MCWISRLAGEKYSVSTTANDQFSVLASCEQPLFNLTGTHTFIRSFWRNTSHHFQQKRGIYAFCACTCSLASRARLLLSSCDLREQKVGQPQKDFLQAPFRGLSTVRGTWSHTIPCTLNMIRETQTADMVLLVT